MNFQRKRYGRCVRRKQGEMNKLEAEYAEYLEARKLAGEVVMWVFDSMKLRLADNTFYTPDFFVQLADDTIEIVETKGFWEDDARVKIKVAASLWPFRFIAIKKRAKKDGGGWIREDF